MFGMIFPETDRQRANIALQRILATAQDEFISLLPHQETPEHALYFEIGLAEYPADGMTLEGLKEMAWQDLVIGPLENETREETPQEVEGGQLPEMAAERVDASTGNA